MEEQNTQQEQPQAEQPQTQAPQPGEEPVMQADPADVEKNKTMAILAYFIFFLPLVTDAKDSPFAKFHANQSLMVLLASIAVHVIMGILTAVTLGFASLLWLLAMLVVFVFWIMGLVNASKGEMKELPLIGEIHLLDK